MSSNQDDEVASWPIRIEEHFIHLLREEAKKGLKTLTLDKSAWAAIENEIFSKFGIRYPVVKLKSKFNRLRKIHREFAKLVGHTGMDWDRETNKVHASEEVWASYLKIVQQLSELKEKLLFKILTYAAPNCVLNVQKNVFAKRFRNKGCPHFHVLGEIFNNRPTTRQGHYASTASPLNYDVVRDLEYDSSGAHISLDAEDGTDASAKGHEGTSKTQKRCLVNPPIDLRSNKESKTFKSAKFDDATERRKNMEVSSPFRELASIEDCMEILEAMEGVDDVAYVRACEKFTSSDWRRMFVKMSEARKRMWLGSLR